MQRGKFEHTQCHLIRVLIIFFSYVPKVEEIVVPSSGSTVYNFTLVKMQEETPEPPTTVKIQQETPQPPITLPVEEPDDILKTNASKGLDLPVDLMPTAEELEDILAKKVKVNPQLFCLYRYVVYHLQRTV